MDPLAYRVAARFAFKYEPKETKQHKADKLTKQLRDATGISKGMAEAIADALVRGREVIRLAIQKGWPIDEAGVLEGPAGSFNLSAVQT